jgi:hypothetical protein
MSCCLADVKAYLTFTPRDAKRNGTCKGEVKGLDAVEVNAGLDIDALE